MAFEYPNRDLPDWELIHEDEARFLLGQAAANAGASPDLLALLRAHRNLRIPSSMGPCPEFRRALAARSSRDLSCADRRALEHYFATELGVVGLPPRKMLDVLAEPDASSPITSGRAGG